MKNEFAKINDNNIEKTKESKKLNKIKKISFYLVSVLFVITSSIMIFEKFNGSVINETDAIAFANEYETVGVDNLFTYIDNKKVIEILKNGTGILFLGYPECKWCQAYAPILNETAKEASIDKIYYFNIKDEREQNSATYRQILKYLEPYLIINDDNTKKVYVPDVAIIKDGNILVNDFEGAFVTKQDGSPTEYWTEERKENLKNKLKPYMDMLNE